MYSATHHREPGLYHILPRAQRIIKPRRTCAVSTLQLHGFGRAIRRSEMTHGGSKKGTSSLKAQTQLDSMDINRDGDEIGDLPMSKWRFWWLERVVCIMEIKTVAMCVSKQWLGLFCFDRSRH